MSSFDFERAWAGSQGGPGFFREMPGVLAIDNAKIVTTNAKVGSATTPALTAGTPPYLLWAANSAVTVTADWCFDIPEDYAENLNGDGDPTDEIRVLLMMRSSTGGTAAAQFTPTISYRRAGDAAASAIALTSYRKGSDLTALVASTNEFTSGTSFQLTDNPTNPEWVELKFRGGGLHAFDAANFLLTPKVNTNHAALLYSARMRAKRTPATEWTQLRV